ncbi:MAG: YcxB family protein [Hyphomicrobiaceae bacterium]|nr:YcxB family protein [Hyphomicrobiaceae bacterium]
MTNAASEDTLTFEAVLRHEHFTDFSKTVQKRLSDGGNRLMWLGLGLLVLVASIGFQWLADDVAIPLVEDAWLGPSEVTLLAFLSGSLLALLYVWIVGQRLTRAYAVRALREGGSYIGPRRFTLTSEGISSSGPNGRSITYWSAIEELTEAPATLLLWTDPGAAVIVPTDAFANMDERKRFEAYVAERIAPSGAT